MWLSFDTLSLFLIEAPFTLLFFDGDATVLFVLQYVNVTSLQASRG